MVILFFIICFVIDQYNPTSVFRSIGYYCLNKLCIVDNHCILYKISFIDYLACMDIHCMYIHCRLFKFNISSNYIIGSLYCFDIRLVNIFYKYIFQVIFHKIHFFYCFLLYEDIYEYIRCYEYLLFDRYLCADSIIDNVMECIISNNVIMKSNSWYTKIIFIRRHDDFISSIRRAGFSEYDIDLIKCALQWQVDLHTLREGDQFSLLISQESINKSIINNRLIGIRLHTSNKDYYAFRADNGNFYNRNAICSSNGFMRFPITRKFRVSSTFNMHRLNPITGRIAPHCGIDIAVPVGTPVLSVADGEVIISKYGGISTGNYIAVRHGSYCVTRYMHLKKILVQLGQTVKKGEKIALSGNTGRSTGPHLHFEVWINKRAVNPLTAKLIYNESLNGAEKIKYLAQVERMLPKLTYY